MEGLLRDPEAPLEALAEKQLKAFTVQMFNEIDPVAYKDNWHIDAICEHLEAVLRREIQRLLITIQFRSMKSTILSVMFPAWAWLSSPGEQFLCASYNHDLAIQDNKRCRRVVQSRKYQSRWGRRFSLVEDQNTKEKFLNSRGGYRMATHTRGSTGFGGSILIVDDPHNVAQAESPSDRRRVITWFREVWSSRINDASTGCHVVAQQCTHADDLAGYIKKRIADGADWEHLNIPSEYEKKYHCATSIGWQDPRKKEGELFWPDHFTRRATDNFKVDLGIFAAAAQMQQRPILREGATFRPEKFIIVSEVPGRLENVVRYWDKAGTEGGGAMTAGTLMGRFPDGGFIILDCIAGQWGVARREAVISGVLESDLLKSRTLTENPAYLHTTWIEQEPGSSGKESSDSTIRRNAGYIIKSDRVTGSKEVRADPYAVQVEAGNVRILEGPWTDAFIEDHAGFPMSDSKDRVDSASGAFNKLAVPVSIAEVW